MGLLTSKRNILDRRVLAELLCPLFATIIVILDATAPLGLAFSALYSAVIVGSIFSDRWMYVRGMALLCTLFIFIGIWVSPMSTVPFGIIIINRFLFIFVLWITAELVVYRLHASAKIREQQRRLESANRELLRLANIDGLTGVANRRRFDKQLGLECARANRSGASLSLLMIDVDFFKLYNDALGHQSGDECLSAIAKVIHDSMQRPTDFVARYGGEEFVVILSSVDNAGARVCAETIRSNIRQLGRSHPRDTGALVTVSIGITSKISPVNPHDLIRLADGALYLAKKNGRDRIEEAN